MQNYILFNFLPAIRFSLNWMRLGVGIAATSLMLTAIDPPAAAAVKHEPNRPTRARFVKDTFGPGAAARAGARAAIGQARNSPHEWGGGAAGFGKRFGSSFAGHVVNNSIKYPVAYARHEALDYQPSHKHGFGPRLTYALESTVITHKTNTGRRTVATGEISGAVGGGLISRLWQPASTHTLAAGFGSAGMALGADAGMNVAREFWPRHPKKRG
jgi:hypothetical protein